MIGEESEHCCTGVGIGWRAELALAISRRKDISFVEIVAENYIKRNSLPDSLLELKERGVEIIPHCITLSPGAAKRPDLDRIRKIDKLAKTCDAKLVSDHVCFVRSQGLESGHLLPVPRNKAGMNVMIENVKFIKENLSVPFALENIATLCDWEDADYNEADFFAELLEKTDTLMLLDLANLYANSINHNFDPLQYLQRLPLHRLAYVHIAGGRMEEKLYHDTHAEPVKEGVYRLLEVLCELTDVPRVMLERDDRFPDEVELNGELDKIQWITGGACTRHSHEYGHRARNMCRRASGGPEASAAPSVGGTPSLARVNETMQTVSEDERELIERMEGALLRALLANGATPEGVNEFKAKASARSLFEKRLRAVQRCLAPHHDEPDGELRDAFVGFQKKKPGPDAEGPCADARSFQRYLKYKQISDLFNRLRKNFHDCCQCWIM